MNIKNILKHERTLTTYLEEKIATLKGVTIYGPKANEKVGITLFNLDGLSSEEVTTYLGNKFGICVRGGFHCAPLAHKSLGTWEQGAVRVSFGPYNTLEEVEYLVSAIRLMLRI